MALLTITVEVDVDPRLEDPHEVAEYLLDSLADDPVPKFVGAEWVSPGDTTSDGAS